MQLVYQCLRVLPIRFAGAYLAFGKHPLDDFGKPTCDFYRLVIGHKGEVNSQRVQIVLGITRCRFTRIVQDVLGSTVALAMPKTAGG